MMSPLYFVRNSLEPSTPSVSLVMAAAGASHWGRLINPDKSPAPLLEQLCLGIAQLMPSFDTGGTADLTPARLAAFYRKVGGNYDPLFLGTKSQALSFIYQSLGCFHSLQPSTNPYEAPSIPSLLPNGFVRWQTIQLLMDPDEHSRFLQNAVSLWDITDAKGELFPKEMPRDAFPSEPDPEMLEWHEGVCKRLEHDYVTRNTSHSSPPTFGAYYNHSNGKGPLPDEGDYFSRDPRRSGSRHHSHFDPPGNRSSRHRLRHRKLSTDHPAVNPRRPESGYFSRPEEVRSGFSSPRAPSPPPERPPLSRGRDRATRYGHTPGLGAGDVPDASDASSEGSFREPGGRRSKGGNRNQHHNLSPGPHTGARRHSHDAYAPRPSRDISPAAPSRPHRSHDSRSSKPSKSDSAPKVYPFEDHSWTKMPGVNFSEYIFTDPATAPPPGSPAFAQGPPPPPPPPRYVPRHRVNIEAHTAEENARGTYSGGSSAGSRPGSGSNGAERPRSFSSAGFYARPSRWTSPVRSSAAKRYVPTSVAEDAGYSPPSRAQVYDQS